MYHCSVRCQPSICTIGYKFFFYYKNMNKLCVSIQIGFQDSFRFLQGFSLIKIFTHMLVYIGAHCVYIRKWHLHHCSTFCLKTRIKKADDSFHLCCLWLFVLFQLVWLRHSNHAYFEKLKTLYCTELFSIFYTYWFSIECWFSHRKYLEHKIKIINSLEFL